MILVYPMGAEFAGDRPEDAGALRFFGFFINDDRGVVVETDVRTVLAAGFLVHAREHGVNDVALLDHAVRRSLLDDARDDVAEAGVSVFDKPPRTRITWRIFAPVLSATLSIERCWTIQFQLSSTDNAPALVFGIGPAFFKCDDIADLYSFFSSWTL